MNLILTKLVIDYFISRLYVTALTKKQNKDVWNRSVLIFEVNETVRFKL